jgi:hypothetical protein
MAHQNTLAFHWHFPFGSGGNCSFSKSNYITEKQQASPSLLTISGKAKREPVLPHHMCTPIYTGLEMMPRVV